MSGLPAKDRKFVGQLYGKSSRYEKRTGWQREMGIRAVLSITHLIKRLEEDFKEVLKEQMKGLNRYGKLFYHVYIVQKIISFSRLHLWPNCSLRSTRVHKCKREIIF